MPRPKGHKTGCRCAVCKNMRMSLRRKFTKTNLKRKRQ